MDMEKENVRERLLLERESMEIEKIKAWESMEIEKTKAREHMKIKRERRCALKQGERQPRITNESSTMLDNTDLMDLDAKEWFANMRKRHQSAQ